MFSGARSTSSPHTQFVMSDGYESAQLVFVEMEARA